MMGIYAIIENGTVVNTVTWDGTGDIFNDITTQSIDGIQAGIGWTYVDGTFIAPPEPELSQEELCGIAEAKKSQLLADATRAIAPLQDAADLDIATVDEAASLASWRKYRVLLARVDTSLAPDIDWPEPPEE